VTVRSIDIETTGTDPAHDAIVEAASGFVFAALL
jgi:hypothetical protein